MIIRPGLKEDSSAIAELLLLAMEEIVYQFIGTSNKPQAYRFLRGLVDQTGNQYSYQNAWVSVQDGQITGIALLYDGSRLQELRQPVINRIDALFNRRFNMEAETQAGELYLDCLAVHPEWQGKGIGSLLINHLIARFAQHEDSVLGLLVDENNRHAKRLYERLGFRVVGEKSLLGKRHEHMQCVPASMHNQAQ
ncbi:MAG: GNAT family N-acetyltransferase [Sphingobacterium sp.]